MDPTNDNKIYHATLIEWLETHEAAPTVDTGSTGLISELRAIRSQSDRAKDLYEFIWNNCTLQRAQPIENEICELVMDDYKV